MRTTTWRALLALGMVAVAGGGLVACGGSSEGAAPTTAATDGAVDDGATDPTTDDGASDPTTPVETTAPPADDQPGCDEITAIVEEVHGATAAETEDLAGYCTITFGADREGPIVGVLWNYGAGDRASFEGMKDMLAGDSMEQVDGGPGTETWVGPNLDTDTVRAYVWIDGAGTWDLSYTPEIDAPGTDADADKLVEIGRRLVEA